MRILRWVLGTVAVLVGLLLVLLGLAWIWTGSEGSARWVLEQVSRRQPLVVDNVRGSLRRGFQADRLAWSQEGLQVEARSVDMAWQPLELLHHLLRIDHLRAASLRIEDRRPKTGAKPTLPVSLALPVRVSADAIAVDRLEVAGAVPVDVRAFAGSYAYDGTNHRVVVRNARAYDGQYRGEVQLAAAGDHRLQASVQGRIAAPVPGVARPVPVTFDAQASGPLAGFDLRLRAGADPGTAGPAMRADATARVTPFGDVPVAAARAELDGFDAGALWPQVPHMLLSGELAAAPRAAGAWAVNANLRNALAGPWDQHRIPASRVQLEGEWRGATAILLRELDAQVGGGRILARGAWEGEEAWRVDGTLSNVDPAALHTALAPVPIGGKLTLRAQGAAIAFDTDLSASGGPVRRTGSELAAAVGALELRSLRARGRWAGQELSLPLLEVRTADAKLDAAVDMHLRQGTGRGRADLEAPGLRARGVGSLSRTQGGGTVKLSLTDIRQAQRWLARVPGVPVALAATAFDGRGDMQLAWQGGWQDPTVQATATIPVLQPAGDTPPAWTAKDVNAKLDGRLADARIDARGQGTWGTRQGSVELVARAGRRSATAWQGELDRLSAIVRDPAAGPGPWRLDVRQPVDWRWSGEQLDTGAGEAVLRAPSTPPSQARIAWDPVRWRAGQLRTAGRVTGLPLAWAELLGGPQLAGAAVAGDLVFDGDWDAQLADTLRLRAQLARRSGDVSVRAEAVDGSAARVQAGVREARLAVDSEGDAVTLTLRWDSERAGTADARLQTRLSRAGGGWSWPDSAPLSGSVQAQLPRLGVWSLLAPPGWRLRGSLAADVNVAGTRGDPQLAGTLRADDLALRSVVDGVALQDGVLRARLTGRRLLVEQLELRGPGPEGGRVAGTGEGGWSRDGMQARVELTLEQLRASSRADRELTVSGRLNASMDAAGAQVRGALRVDRARITLPDEAAPKLGDDVAVRNLPAGASLGREARPVAQGPRGRPVTLAVDLDFGRDFRVHGRGIDTRLVGTLAISGDSLAEPRLVGTIRTVGGEYRAYGQNLEIERGVLRFTGPIDNPVLDILALRPRLAGNQKAGVQITGSAQAPFVRLYSDPQLTEAETLSWLVLGRASASGGAETALLQQAAVALLASRAHRGDGKGVAAMVGLDELSVSRAGAEGPAVTLGKRLGRNLYAAYERSLSGAVGTLSVYYDLSRRVTVRASAGERSALDLIFTFTYD